MLAFLFASWTAKAALPAQCPTPKEMATHYVYVGIDGNSKIKADRILVYKSTRELFLLSQNQILAHNKISLGLNPEGPKRQQGDFKTPEGRYFISLKNPFSAYHLSLKLSYPDANDKKWAREHNVSPGGDIFVHGWPNDPQERSEVEKLHGRVDWTYGCIAVKDDEIEQIYSMVETNTVIDICPN